MLRALLAIGAVAILAWLAFDRLDLGGVDPPPAPTVQYPVIDGGGGVGGVGEGTGGLLGG